MCEDCCKRSSVCVCAELLHRGKGLVYERTLRKNWRIFLQDIVSLLCGVRSVVLLDYLQLPADRLRSQLTPIWKSWPMLKAVTVLELLDGVFLMRWDLLEPRVAREVSCHDNVPPLFIRIDNGPPHLTPVKETRHVVEHLSRFFLAMKASSTSLNISTLSSLPLWLDMGREGWGALSPNSSSLVPFPTLAGWLLGYPAVYLFNLYNGELAARTLSSSSLQVYDIQVGSADLGKLFSSSGPSCTPGSQAPGEFSILRFSVPSELLADSCVGEDLRRRVNEGVKRIINVVTSKMDSPDEPMKLTWVFPKLIAQIHGPQAVAL